MTPRDFIPGCLLSAALFIVGAAVVLYMAINWNSFKFN